MLPCVVRPCLGSVPSCHANIGRANARLPRIARPPSPAATTLTMPAPHEVEQEGYQAEHDREVDS